MTEYFLGRRTQFNYAIEGVAYGTPNTAATFAWLGQVEKVTPDDSKDIKDIVAMDDTDTRDVSGHDILVKRYGNTISFKPQHMRHLVLPFGNTDVMTGTSPYVHTIGLGANVLPSFGMQVGFQHTSPFGIRYDGCVCKTYEIGSTKGDFVRCAMSTVAKTATKITSFKSYQATSLALKKYTNTQLRPFRHSDVSAVLGGVDYSGALNQWRISMDNGLVAEPHDDDTISEPIPGLRIWSGSLDINMASSTVWDLVEAAATTTLVITLQKTSSDKVVFTVNDPILEVANPPFDVTQGLVNVSIPFKATSISPVVTDAISVDYDTVCT